MLVATSVRHDARVLREASTLQSAGHEVTVIGRDVPDGPTLPFTVMSTGGGTGLSGRLRSAQTAGALRPVARWFLLPRHRSSVFGAWRVAAVEAAAPLSFDVVHAHDFTALEAGAELARRSGTPFVYDAHEWWSHRMRVGRPTPLQRLRESELEGELGARAAVVLTVGDALADRLRAEYGWTRVRVVRNAFEPLDPPGGDAPMNSSGALYAGRLAAGRDLETVAAASTRSSQSITLVGPADPTWVRTFDPKACTMLPQTSLDEVDRLLSTTGVAIISLEPRAGNHEVALPNKLFHAVRVGIPVVAADLGELGRTVVAHDLGALYRPGDVGSLVEALERTTAQRLRFSRSVREAQPALSWARDREVLLSTYAELAMGSLQ